LPVFRSEKGYTLVELVVVIIIIGIIAGIAVNSLKHSTEVARIEETKQELDLLAQAIAGDPDLISGGSRSDFGYVGDIGALPSSLDALVTNPGGYATWRGPYIRDEFSTGAGNSEFQIDAWGAAYSYAGGTAISSTGGPTSITRELAGSADDLLHNAVSVAIVDLDFTPPGNTYRDSVTVALTYPNGTGSITTRTVSPSGDGFARIDSVPVGVHMLRVVYTPDNDTISRKVTISPGEDYYADIQYYANVWTAVATCAGGGTMVLRPDGVGSQSDLTSDGCGSNWQCVDESATDEDATRVYRAANSWATDCYALEDPASSTCTITGVTVWARARRAWNQGGIRVSLYTGGSLYQGADQGLTTSYQNFSEEWTTNPNTGAAWTWTEVTDLQAAIRLRGQNFSFPAYCTQVWIEVSYGP